MTSVTDSSTFTPPGVNKKLSIAWMIGLGLIIVSLSLFVVRALTSEDFRASRKMLLSMYSHPARAALLEIGCDDVLVIDAGSMNTGAKEEFIKQRGSDLLLACGVRTQEKAQTLSCDGLARSLAQKNKLFEKQSNPKNSAFSITLHEKTESTPRCAFVYDHLGTNLGKMPSTNFENKSE